MPSFHRLSSRQLVIFSTGIIAALALPADCRSAENATAAAGSAAWKMHHINREFWDANSLSPGDVNGDGFEDYAVVHEMWAGFKSTFSLTLHPGPGGDIYQPWRKVTIYEAPVAFLEYSVFGDFDGDGNLDVAGLQGPESFPDVGAPSGVRFLWGPGAANVTKPEAWIDSGLLPQTENQGHFHYARSFDVNGDGALDVVFGGRVHMRNKKPTGIGWLEAPARQSERRDISKWIVHPVDPDILSGHGFIFADIDEDGDMDIVVNNADWDTPDSQEATAWYENPGVGAESQKERWVRHVIHRGPEYYSKTQVAVGDVDGDGLKDLVIQSGDPNHRKSIYLFRKLKQKPGEKDWERIEIPRPAETDWLARPILTADLNGDGRLDIVGALIHDEKGNLAAGKASVYWMEWKGNKPMPESWVTHVIKWSDGIDTGTNERGEKWDHLRTIDLDGDGDLDIVANTEEHHTADRKVIVGEVWFENPLFSPKEKTQPPTK